MLHGTNMISDKLTDKLQNSCIELFLHVVNHKGSLWYLDTGMFHLVFPMDCKKNLMFCLSHVFQNFSRFRLFLSDWRRFNVSLWLTSRVTFIWSWISFKKDKPYSVFEIHESCIWSGRSGDMIPSSSSLSQRFRKYSWWPYDTCASYLSKS